MQKSLSINAKSRKKVTHYSKWYPDGTGKSNVTEPKGLVTFGLQSYIENLLLQYWPLSDLRKLLTLTPFPVKLL